MTLPGSESERVAILRRFVALSRFLKALSIKHMPAESMLWRDFRVIEVLVGITRKAETFHEPA